MLDNRNALAELAERLQLHLDDGRNVTETMSIWNDFLDAQRIIANLAKVGFNDKGQPRDEWIACEAVEKCRQIAEDRARR